MSTEPKIKSTNPIMKQILKRYVGADNIGADSVGADSVDGSPLDAEVANNSADWYNMTCPRCPWFVDGERTGQYAMVGDDNDAAVCDMASDSSSAPDNNAPVAGKDADGDSGRAAGDSGRVGDDDTPWDEEWDELLDGVDAECDKSDDIIGLDEPDDMRRVPIVQCVRPELAECLNNSFCVRLLVASDLIRRQAALTKTMNEMKVDATMCAEYAATGGDAGRKPTQREKRNRKLIKAARKRGR